MTTPAAKSNGQKVTVAALAKVKRLPVDHLLNLGLRDTPRGVEIPYFDFTGEELFARLRVTLTGKNKTLQPKGVKLAAYGSQRIDKAHKAGVLFLVEGESDCWALWYHNLTALGCPGSGAAKVLQAEHVEAVGAVYIVVEPGQGGERFRAGVQARLAALNFTGNVYELWMPAGVKDPADLHAAGPGIFLALFQRAVTGATPLTLTAGKQPAGDTTGDEKKGKPTQAEQLLELAGAAEYIHTADGKSFALVNVGEGDGEHLETLSLRTKGFRNWLSREYYRATGKAASSKTMQDALALLEARAAFDGAERSVYCRVGPAQEAIYLDLGDSDWQTVRVDSAGWCITRHHTPLFRRPRGTLALPIPLEGGDLNELRPFVNVRDEEWPLVVASLLQALNPRGPYPVVCLHGEQGAAKSTTGRVLRSIIDPNTAPLRSEPRDVRDLVISANNSWMMVLDNLSHLEPWLSDALCRLSTGGGFSTRELYTDDEEIIFDSQRPVILTGIEEVVTRGDLMDRSLLFRLPQIDEENRQTEADFWQRFHGALPRILGAFLTALSGVLREQPRVRLASLPRMADFAITGVAAELALGWKRGTFLAAYAANRGEANRVTLDSSMIFPTFEAFVETLPGGQWSGTWQTLLDRLNAIGGHKQVPPKYWPGTPRALSGQLRRLAPTLRTMGISVQFDHRDGSKNNNRLVLIDAERHTIASSAPSEPSEAPQMAGSGRTVADGQDTGSGGSDSCASVEKAVSDSISDRSGGSDGKNQTRSPSSAGVEEGEI
jgi:hypothetical protein